MVDCKRDRVHRATRLVSPGARHYLGLVAAVLLLGMLVFGGEPVTARTAPLVIALIALVSFGVRLVTSTRRHLIRFDMAGEVLDWRSPAIDFKSKSAAARSVREIAEERGLLR